MNKKFLTFAVVLFFGGLTVNAAPTTRYWDACKPSCSWNGNAGGSPNGTCISCDVSGNKQSGEGGQSACSGGNSYTCMGQAPWAVNDNLSYGFAASHSNGDCGKCYELTFTNNGEGGTSGGNISGKKMIIMVSNIGNIQANATFDLMIPGGGVGDFDALTNQVKQNGNNGNIDWGARYGGFRADYQGGCGNNAACVKQRCDAAFSTPALSHLKEGCYWYIDWFKIANNPSADHREVSCPPELVSVYKGNTWRPSGNNPPPSSSSIISISSSSSIRSSSSISNISSSSTNNSGSVNWSGTGVLKIEAENYVSKVGANMVTNTENGVTCIGYIENGYSATYRINMSAAGTFPTVFNIASGVSNSSFTVWVNGTQVGTISKSGSDWNSYSTVSLNPNVSLRQGENTIELRFNSAINVDYLQLTGSTVVVSSSSSNPPPSSSSNPPPSSSSTPLSSSSSAGTTPVAPLQAYSNNAYILTNGVYLQVANNAKLELFDLRGNSIKKMSFSSGVHSVQLNDLPKGLYLAKVSFGSERKILRVPLR